MIPHCPGHISLLPDPGSLVRCFTGGNAADEGFQAMMVMPSLLFPLLLVLFAGLCMLNQFRRNRGSGSVNTENI
ncbi:hypothetical protein WJU16_14560 [Chitinophaga pollutisoli]|uniref:Uncharacterized protein n=1 Tax=Chitinophaga pollutisoli TaxID=3133966 RepID=A0ABZ2YIJ8_9BACT